MEYLTPEHGLLLIGAAAIIGMLAEYLRHKRKLAAVLIGTASGIATLLLLHFYGEPLGFTPPLTAFTVGTAAVGGIPAVLLLALLNLLLPP